MAKNRDFSLYLDSDNPKDKEAKEKDPATGKYDIPGTEVDLKDYLNGLDDGKLNKIGTIYSGPNNLLSSDERTPKCVYVYIGGTCYKICK